MSWKTACLLKRSSLRHIGDMGKGCCNQHGERGRAGGEQLLQQSGGEGGRARGTAEWEVTLPTFVAPGADDAIQVPAVLCRMQVSSRRLQPLSIECKSDVLHWVWMRCSAASDIAPSRVPHSAAQPPSGQAYWHKRKAALTAAAANAAEWSISDV